jgi:zinc transport system permease protein
VSFDREFARSQGMPVQCMEYLLIGFIALTIVACLRMVGIVLVLSLLTIPQGIANLLTNDYKKMMWLSILIGYLSCLGGLFFSYFWNVPSGACIILVSVVIYLIVKFCMILRKRK